VLSGHVDTAHMGVAGHSLGGATAAEVCRLDARFAAGADLEGPLYPEAKTSSLTQPFLLFESDRRGDRNDTFVAAWRGPSCRVIVAGSYHLDFIDAPYVSPILPYLTPSVARRGAKETLRGTNDVVVAFFDATLRGDPSGWARLRAPRPRFTYTCAHLPVP
jgi:hypothetical protein